jgi:aspartate racemase
MELTMKQIGLIGGLSWESSAEYYRTINEEIGKRLGGSHSARCVMTSFDFAEIEALQVAGRWNEATRMMIEAASNLEKAGADCIVICANTMHLMATDIERAVPLPLIHIADPTARAVQQAGIKKVGLLGTRYTMEKEFYRARLADKFGLDVRIPDEQGRAEIHDIVYKELILGVVRDESRAVYQRVMQKLADDGAEGIILGCTEITMLIQPEHSPVPVFDTTQLHALAAVDFALS